MEKNERAVSITDLKEILVLLEVTGAQSASFSAFRDEEDGSEYAVWLVEADGSKYVLKKAKGFETEIYRSFFVGGKTYVPAFLGSCAYDGGEYILMEYCPGRDLRICERGALIKVLDALTSMQDEFWQRRDLSDTAITPAAAMKAVEDRGRYLGSAVLEEAYERFISVYKETPVTLCHDDLLPINVIVGEKAVMIDWEYGGILPYPLPFARLIAHARPDRNAYFFMSDEDRDFAVRYYYDRLLQKRGISFGEYRRTLEHFLFYEYCEWVEMGNRYDSRSDERYSYCLGKTEKSAGEILGTP